MCFHSETYLGVANPAKHQKHKKKLGDRKNVGTNDVPTFLLIHFIYVHTCLIVYVAEMLEKTIMFHLAQRRCCGVSYSLFDVKYVIAASLLRKI